MCLFQTSSASARVELCIFSPSDATIFVQDRDSPPLPLAGWDRQRNSRFLVPDSPCTDAEKEGGETDSDEVRFSSEITSHAELTGSKHERNPLLHRT